LPIDRRRRKCYAKKMQSFTLKSGGNKTILALGAESAGNFSIYSKNKICFSRDFGDLLIDKNFQNYQTTLSGFLKKNKIKPDIILIDLHPLYRTTELGKNLSKKYRAKLLPVQHHLAHIFAAVGEEQLTKPTKFNTCFYGLACDGTGYGQDNKIWGGEVFKFTATHSKIITFERIGRLENQIMIGADLAVKEPARMLLAVLAKFLSKEQIYVYLKKYYNRNEFSLLFNQLSSGFNTTETSSTGRVLDAIALLLGFAGNERQFKHQPTRLLEEHSTIPYDDLKPKILPDKKTKKLILLTTPLFEYLIKNLRRNKKRLAATAQLYLAQGFYKIINAHWNSKAPIYLGGGLMDNRIISSYLKSRGAIGNKKIASGDASLAFGQLVYYLLS